MKVLHVTSQRPDSTGSGTYLQAILQEAARSGHVNYLLAGIQADRPAVLDGLERNNSLFVLFETLENPGYIVGMSDVMPYRSRTYRELDELSIARYLDLFRQQLQAAVEDFQPDVIHTHHLWLVSAMARQSVTDIPMVTSCHGSELRQFHQCPHLRDRVIPGCRQLDRVLALTSDQQNDICTYYTIPQDRIQVTGAGYQPALFYPGPARPESGTIEILYAGKISRAKGVPWLLKTLCNLRRFPFHLHLAGSGTGEEYRSCLKLAGHLQNRVTLHGHVSQQRLAELMRRAQVFILPSLHEGLPLVILEALACGCRVIATDLAGTREIASRLDNDLLIQVQAPRIIDTDRSELEDENSFIAHLEAALLPLLTNFTEPHLPSDALDWFCWHAVFKRIENVWLSFFR